MDTIKIEVYVHHVELRSIVLQGQLRVKQRRHDIMRIHHVARHHVQISLNLIHTIQAMRQAITVAGTVQEVL